jgi:asparagine synthase (glutamine-hydrolysing)
MLSDIYDEPFADSSQIPTFLVSKLARQSVSVSLSGDGGDELFGGYSRYILATKIWAKLCLVPLPFRTALAELISQASPTKLNIMIDNINHYFGSIAFIPLAGWQVSRLAGLIRSSSIENVYLNLISDWINPDSILLRGVEPKTILSQHFNGIEVPDQKERLMAMDVVTYLPDEILCKVDRASMAVGLESRTPFLDPDLAKFAWTLPSDMKTKNGTGKWILREVLYRYLPKEMVDRPKKGFSVPIGQWLRGPLKEWAEELLNENRLHNEGFFNARIIRELWLDHLGGATHCSNRLWNILMFQAWLERNPSE